MTNIWVPFLDKKNWSGGLKTNAAVPEKQKINCLWPHRKNQSVWIKPESFDTLFLWWHLMTVCFICVKSAGHRAAPGRASVDVIMYVIMSRMPAPIRVQSEHIGQWATPHHLSDVRRGAPSWIWDYLAHSDVTIYVLNAIHAILCAIAG